MSSILRVNINGDIFGKYKISIVDKDFPDYVEETYNHRLLNGVVKILNWSILDSLDNSYEIIEFKPCEKDFNDKHEISNSREKRIIDRINYVKRNLLEINPDRFDPKTITYNNYSKMKIQPIEYPPY